MSHFVASPCKIDGNSLVNKVAWSYVDPIAALATVVMDEKNRKVYKVQFMNSEVSSRFTSSSVYSMYIV